MSQDVIDTHPAAGDVPHDAGWGGEEVGRGVPSAPPSDEARAAGHETEDANSRRLAFIIVLMGVSVAVVIGAMVLLLRGIDHARVANEPRFTAEQTAAVSPPLPHLQAAPFEDIAQLHAYENDLLTHYAWIDKAHTRARIPIERAMALLAGRTLDPAP
jgi:hypothetical protein